MQDESVVSWSTFLSHIESARSEIRCDKTLAWFRGVSDSKHRLYPSLLRPRNSISKSHERTLFEEFTDFDEEGHAKRDSWERLVRMQHYGIPTRLLDWTEVFGVALYFALKPADRSAPSSPSIWILNPFSLAQMARKNGEDKSIGVFHRENDADYFDQFLSRSEPTWPFEAPMPYRPPKLTPRIRAQKGFFTVHGTDSRPLDAIFRDCVRQVRLPPNAFTEAEKFLQLAGIDSYSLFPDFEGFSRRIRDRYEYHPQ